MSSHAPSVLALCAGLAVCAANASAQFSAFSGDITLNGGPVGPQFVYNGTLGFAAFDDQFNADATTSSGATITHTGDLVMGGGFFSNANLDIAGAGTSWSTKGNLSFASALSSEGRIRVMSGAEFLLNGDATFGTNTAIDRSFEFVITSGSAATITGHLNASNFNEGGQIVVQDGTLNAGSIALNGFEAELQVFGGTVTTGTFDIIEDSRLRLESGFGLVSVLNSGASSIGFGARVDLDGAGTLWNADSLTFNDLAQLNVTDGAALNVAGAFDTTPFMSISGGSTLDVGSIDGALTFSQFEDSSLRVRDEGFAITDAFPAGSALRLINAERFIDIGGELSVETSVVLNGGLIKAGSLDPSQLSNITGTGSIELETAEVAAGLDLTNGGSLVGEGIGFTFTNLSNNGRIDDGFFAQANGALQNGLAGEIILNEGARLEQTDFANEGEINILGRPAAGSDVRLDVSGEFNNFPTGSIFAREADLRVPGGINNAGTLGFTFGGSTILGDVFNTGLITITGDSQVTFFDDVNNNGTINLASASSFTGAATVFGTYAGAGDVTGGGDLFLLGDVSVGNSPADVLWDASLFFGPTTDTLVEIAGTGAGLFDRITITGDFAIAGDLDVAFLDGFLLQEGMRFDVFNVAGAKTGAFNGLAEGSLVGTYNGMDLFITYDNEGLGNVALFSVPTPGAAALLLTAGLFTRRRRS